MAANANAAGYNNEEAGDADMLEEDFLDLDDDGPDYGWSSGFVEHQLVHHHQEIP